MVKTVKLSFFAQYIYQAFIVSFAALFLPKN